MASLDEQRLIERLKRSDETAFNELVLQYQGQIYRLLLRMLSDPAEAEDVAQEVFITVFKSIGGFRGDAKLSTWLYRVASNHGKNRIKYLARRARDTKREIDDPSIAASLAQANPRSMERPDEMAAGHEAQDHIRRALEGLDEEQRVLVVLRDLENLTYEEIQRVTGLPSGTVKSRLHRARMALHKEFLSLQRGKP